jgi:RpiR family carbohydrate utilization transcriptional regulator
VTIVIDIVELINSSMRSLRESEQQVAAVVLADQQFAITASTTDLAKRANVSATSITRFCRALGFAGLREFKLCLAQNLAVNARFMANSVTHTDSFSELARAMKEALTTALSDAASDLDIAAFAAALDVIATVRHLCVLPVDQLSQGSAFDTHVRLLRMGIESSVHLLPDEQRMIIGSARSDVGFIVLTSDATAPDVSDLLDILNSQDNPAVLISPALSRGQTFNGIHLAIRNNLPVEIFAQSAVRYKQAMVIDLLCTGHSLNLSEGILERRRPVNEQLPPPLKRPEP